MGPFVESFLQKTWPKGFREVILSGASYVLTIGNDHLQLIYRTPTRKTTYDYQIGTDQFLIDGQSMDASFRDEFGRRLKGVEQEVLAGRVKVIGHDR